VLLIHGEKDKTVNVSNPYKIHEHNPQLFDLHIIPNLAHINIPNTMVVEIMNEWLKEKKI